MLGSWGVLPLYGGHSAPGWCAGRTSKELTVYSVTGWVRTKRNESDGDWHIELTAAAAGDPLRCIVAEIPDPSYGSQYQAARDQFVSVTGISATYSGGVATAVRIKVIGPAFFDGEHRGGRGTTNAPHGHGHCNASTRALWEIHPVYLVSSP
jgi:hypothetical protein